MRCDGYKFMFERDKRLSVMTLAALATTALGSALPPHHTPPLSTRSTALHTGDITYFHPALGACGRTNGDDDLIGSLPQSFFDRYTPGGNPNLNSLCGTRVRVRRGDRHVDVEVVDRCVGCADGDIDISIGAFKHIADVGEGRVAGSWEQI
ncbi:hypothetical protein MCOR27_010592 [Pyricularia oryzae]|uniref:RlpA-like protein double-psi beta-barrel domain-containing protein n=1 Tax=Pyricularia grisea TaxID=148305 RepID=A0ABQ8NI80_PYRGI|nr:hypothetical protein MCOR27_010592 [Pyricularia oryzae]KAI6297540.1 hypothetical protein MCOR33_006193 [Pyricularia grisea]KAI6279075.1 hypothetical protein MCOR26_004315 [Pyricularia oryzae]KAI6307708.1 hypothetical protein MCOR30_011646 [Pyricularia oryzae]KAI6329960.1 hypothetical protein MCOR29_002045 [Pyricularia oryzae]